MLGINFMFDGSTALFSYVVRSTHITTTREMDRIFEYGTGSYQQVILFGYSDPSFEFDRLRAPGFIN